MIITAHLIEINKNVERGYHLMLFKLNNLHITIIKLLILLIALLTFFGCVQSESEGQEARIKGLIGIILQDSNKPNTYRLISNSESSEMANHAIIFSSEDCVSVINKNALIKPAKLTYPSSSESQITVQGMLIKIDAKLKIGENCPEIIEVFLYLPELNSICEHESLLPRLLNANTNPGSPELMYSVANGYFIKFKEIKVKL